LLWTKQPTSWRNIECLLRGCICQHHMWTRESSNQIINSIGDFKWSGVWLRISQIVVIFGGIKASYIHLSCHKPWCFTLPLMPWNLAEKKNAYWHTSRHSLLSAPICTVRSLIEGHLCSIYDCKGHKRDTTWYFKEPNKNYIWFEGWHDKAFYTQNVCVWPALHLIWGLVSRVATVIASFWPGCVNLIVSSGSTHQ
jgi:hypothetical protein